MSGSGSVALRQSSLRDWCKDTDGCELDDGALLDCAQNVDNSQCGSMPASCEDLKACYEQTH